MLYCSVDDSCSKDALGEGSISPQQHLPCQQVFVSQYPEVPEVFILPLTVPFLVFLSPWIFKGKFPERDAVFCVSVWALCYSSLQLRACNDEDLMQIKWTFHLSRKVFTAH